MKFFTLKEALSFGYQDLKRAGMRKPLRDSRILLSFLLNVDKSWLMANLDSKIEKEKFNQFLKLIERRAINEPIQYITNIQPFFKTYLKVGKGCLIPRAETEFLVEETLKIATTIKSPVIADLGCGSGAIIKALSGELKKAIFIGIEKEINSLYWAKQNLNQIHNCQLILGDFGFHSFLKNVDIIVCNPPYLSKEEIKKLPDEIKLYEPPSALFTPSPFYYYEKVINFAENSLKPSGYVIFEIGSCQAKRVNHFKKISKFFEVVKKVKDYGKRLRVVILKKKI